MLLGVGHTGRSVVRRPRASYVWRSAVRTSFVRTAYCFTVTNDNLNTTYQDIITTVVLNTMLHHVGMLWIIETHEKLQYHMDKNNSELMTGGPWYNTSICKKLHGKVFEVFIRNAITDRYNIVCSIDAHEK